MVTTTNSTRGLRKKNQPKTKKPIESFIPVSMERIEQLKNESTASANLARSEFETFHERLKELRENRIENKIGFRLKQNEAAFLTDQLPPNYNRVEKGLIKPSIDLLIQLSELFGVTIDFLVKGKYATNLYTAKEDNGNTPSSEGILNAYKQIVSAKDQQIIALNDLVEHLQKENKKLSGR
jgi:transcriptional regulator with XRE-family HTH domain